MPRTLVYMIIQIEVYVVMSLSRGWLMRAYAPAKSLARTPAIPFRRSFSFFRIRTFFSDLRRVFFVSFLFF